MIRKKRSARQNQHKAAAMARRQRWRRAAARALAVAATAVVVPLAALVCIMAHDLVTQGSFCAIDRMEITGNTRLSRQEILRQADIHEALNLLGVNIRVVRERLMAHPWIAEASVARHFPDRLVIAVLEEVPFAQFDIRGRWYLANAAGVLFVSDKDPEPGVPIVTGVSPVDLDIHGRPPVVLRQTVATARGHFSMDGNPATETGLRKIAYDPDIGIVVHATPRLGAIRLGIPPAEDAFTLAEQIAATLSSSGHANTLAAIDITNPNRIVVMPGPLPEHREDNHEESQDAAKI